MESYCSNNYDSYCSLISNITLDTFLKISKMAVVDRYNILSYLI